MYFHFKPIICSLLVGCISFSSIAYAIDNTSDTIISSTKTSSINDYNIEFYGLVQGGAIK